MLRSLKKISVALINSLIDPNLCVAQNFVLVWKQEIDEVYLEIMVAKDLIRIVTHEFWLSNFSRCVQVRYLEEFGYPSSIGLNNFHEFADLAVQADLHNMVQLSSFLSRPKKANHFYSGRRKRLAFFGTVSPVAVH